ncbi:hypothetical protein KMZ93_13615 [Bradyrhizobium sediminis]|uniref:Uncharacterized protein n=1 Tax=Bradyrhizobium sediminis TaxID=2840469 RepID=A0A975NU93_9BRAD|nr:hypothetical protein KMZ93_13615 [Bradyrhizobium sediminis]
MQVGLSSALPALVHLVSRTPQRRTSWTTSRHC